MAQQGLKKKSGKFAGVSKSHSKFAKHTKPLGPRKGGKKAKVETTYRLSHVFSSVTCRSLYRSKER